MRYTVEQLDNYEADRLKWLDRADALRNTILLHRFSDAQAEEYSRVGFLRRIGYLEHALERMAEVFPPNQPNAARDAVRDAELLLQAFVMNVFGSIDNLAKIWALENCVTGPNNHPLSRQETAFVGRRAKHLRASLTPRALSAVTAHTDWFRAMETYRHGVAHQIPIYIPRLLSQADVVAAEHIDAKMKAALDARNFETWGKLAGEKHQLGDYGGLMALDGVTQPIMFHPQMVCDLATVVELAEVIFGEMGTPTI